MWELDHKEVWALKNWCFKLWCWRRFLWVPWTSRKSNLSILKEINPKCSLERLRLKLQYFCQLMWRVDLFERPLMLRKIEGDRRGGWQRMRQLGSNIDSIDMSLSKLWETVEDREAWPATVYGVTKYQTWLSNWTTSIKITKAQISSITADLSVYFFFIQITYDK